MNRERFEEIMEEIKSLVEEAYRGLPNRFEKDRAKAYWYGHIMTAVDKNNDFIGGSMATMEDSLNSFCDEDDEEEEDDEDIEDDGEE